jgi:hypothetical protein
MPACFVFKLIRARGLGNGNTLVEKGAALTLPSQSATIAAGSP